jgi:hypothetical protein
VGSTPALYTGWMSGMLAITETHENNENKGSRIAEPKKYLKESTTFLKYFSLIYGYWSLNEGQAFTVT